MKILILTPRFPLPRYKGDKLRSMQTIEKLAREHELVLISYIARSEEKYIDEVLQYCDVKTVREKSPDRYFEAFKSFINSNPLQVNFFNTRKMRELVTAAVKDVDAVHLSTVRPAGNLPEEFNCKLVVDFIDALSLNFERRCDHAQWPLKNIYHLEFERMKDFEKLMIDKSALTMAVSPTDAEALGDSVHVIPNSVDTIAFSPPDENADRRDIIFTGNLNYTPNIEAAETMALKVIPVINAKHPDITLRLVGINPHKRVKALQSSNVEVIGFVPNIADEIRKSEVAVAPMVSGSGLQNKILEAMACATPVVSTIIGNAGINADHKVNILTASTVESFTDHVIDLLDDNEKARAMGIAGRQFVEDNFSFDATAEKLLSLYRGL